MKGDKVYPLRFGNGTVICFTNWGMTSYSEQGEFISESPSNFNSYNEVSTIIEHNNQFVLITIGQNKNTELLLFDNDKLIEIKLMLIQYMNLRVLHYK